MGCNYDRHCGPTQQKADNVNPQETNGALGNHSAEYKGFSPYAHLRA